MLVLVYLNIMGDKTSVSLVFYTNESTLYETTEKGFTLRSDVTPSDYHSKRNQLLYYKLNKRKEIQIAEP